MCGNSTAPRRASARDPTPHRGEHVVGELHQVAMVDRHPGLAARPWWWREVGAVRSADTYEPHTATSTCTRPTSRLLRCAVHQATRWSWATGATGCP